MTEKSKENKTYKVIGDDGNQSRASKYDGILFNIFAAYCFGRKPKEISEMFDVPVATFHYLKQKHRWEDKRKEYMDLSEQKAFYDLVQTKADLTKMANAIASLAGASIIELAKKDKYDFKVTDFNNAVKTFMLLSGEATERIEGNFFNKALLEEIAEELSPQERGILIDVTKKISEKMKQDKQEKALYLAK